MNARYLTINSVIRKYQIETNRVDHLMEDETRLHDAQSVHDFAGAVRSGFPDARITWAMSWWAITDPDPRFAEIRATVRAMHEQYGDDVTFLPGGYFANAYNTREQINRDIGDALGIIQQFMGRYRPTALVAGFLSAANIRYAAREHGIHTVQGNVWSQYSIDAQDGDGSIAYPYYPSTQHFCKPAQGQADFIDCLNLDGWTIDLVAGRMAGDYWKGDERYVSRMGVGPLETLHTFGVEKGLRQMQATTQAHFGAENVERNPFAWVTNCYEISEVNRARRHRPETLQVFGEWVAWIKRTWPDAQCPTIAEFGQQVRAQHPDNESLAYILNQRGTGIGASFADQEVVWFMNKYFRLGIVKEKGKPFVMDYTDYTRLYQEPQEVGQRNWTLFGEINQKQIRPQDRPVPLAEFPRWPALRERIKALYPSQGAAAIALLN
ncbi:MAG: DUF3863 domain-containing protein [Chloroflexi bacterium]|nr:DUF3863 domain-containing protein [Chloroflexota bacterium]